MFRRTSITVIDTIIFNTAFIAILEVFIKATFFYASCLVVLIAIASVFVFYAEIPSRGTRCATGLPVVSAGAITFSPVVGVITPWTVSILTEAHVVSTQRRGSVGAVFFTLFKLSNASSWRSTFPPVCVKSKLEHTISIAKMISQATGSIAFYPVSEALSALANSVVCIKFVLSYANVITQNIAFNTRFIVRGTRCTPVNAVAIAISVVDTVVMLTVSFICTAEALVSTLCSVLKAGSIALFILSDAFSIAFTIPQVCVKIVLNEAFSVAQGISISTLSIIAHCGTAGLRLVSASFIAFIMIFLTSAENIVIIIIVVIIVINIVIIIVSAIKITLSTPSITWFRN